MRMKAQLEKLQADISSVARRTGITSATQLAKLVPKETEKGMYIIIRWGYSFVSYVDGILFLNSGFIVPNFNCSRSYSRY